MVVTHSHQGIRHGDDVRRERRVTEVWNGETDMTTNQAEGSSSGERAALKERTISEDGAG